MSSPLQSELDDVFAGLINRGTLVGADVAVIRDGAQLYRKAWGWKDREDLAPMTPGTVFRYASLTKTIVSVVALRLSELAFIALDDPVTRYVPDFQPPIPSGQTAIITLRQLMTHTAGLSYGFLQEEGGAYSNAGISDGLDGAGISNMENLRRIGGVPLSYVPGERWGYSVATDVLGAVLECATESDLQTLVHRYVCAPLKMQSTSFKPEDRATIAVPYRDGVPVAQRMKPDEVIAVGTASVARFTPDRAWIDGTGCSGGAGLFGTVDDYVQFLEAIRLGGHPILSSESVRGLTTNAVDSLDVTPPGPGWGYGLGAAVLVNPAVAQTPHLAGTWHWSGAYGNYWFVDPRLKLTVVMLTNTAFAGMAGEVPDRVRDCVYRHV